MEEVKLHIFSADTSVIGTQRNWLTMAYTQLGTLRREVRVG